MVQEAKGHTRKKKKKKKKGTVLISKKACTNFPKHPTATSKF